MKDKRGSKKEKHASRDGGSTHLDSCQTAAGVTARTALGNDMMSGWQWLSSKHGGH